jgi:hypothetical protein
MQIFRYSDDKNHGFIEREGQEDVFLGVKHYEVCILYTCMYIHRYACTHFFWQQDVFLGINHYEVCIHICMHIDRYASTYIDVHAHISCDIILEVCIYIDMHAHICYGVMLVTVA